MISRCHANAVNDKTKLVENLFGKNTINICNTTDS